VYTAVILAGGSSRRMGKDKPELLFNGKTFLQAAVDRFSESFDDVFISVADPKKYASVQAKRVVDVYPGCGPMAGLHASLLACRSEGVFLVAADLPFSSPDAAKMMISLCGENDICIMKDMCGRYEPLFAYYRKTLLPELERLLKSGRYKMTELFVNASIRIAGRNELGDAWRDDILLNINYPDDYSKLLGGK
jgi:molybdopterin-guanine dinucleotide biosynthesis protein A